MRISFRHVDEEYFGVEEYIRPVANQAVVHNQFICIICEILNVFNKYTEHIVADVKKAMKCFEYRLDKEDKIALSAYRELTEKVEQFYWNVVDDEFGEKLREFNEEQYRRKGMRYPDNRLGQYRGLLFEELVSAAVKTRFVGRLYCTGCQVYINGCRVLARYGEGSASHKETIDIAGWDAEANYGEFYECKINPERFRNENYRYFMELKSTLDSNGIQDYKIGLVSADATENLRAQKRYLEAQDQNCRAEFMLIGREDIFSVQSYCIPEIT